MSYIRTGMESSPPCSECRAIARELAEAYAEAWDSADPHARRAWTAIIKMRSEEDAQRAEELLRSMPPRSDLRAAAEFNEVRRLRKLQNTPIMLALNKKYSHESRTGHRVNPEIVF
jgi:acyl-CoA hydrolase